MNTILNSGTTDVACVNTGGTSSALNLTMSILKLQRSE